jgi:hypothetical protein
MLPILRSRESISPKLPEADPGRTNEIVMCSRIQSLVICDHAVIEKIGEPSLRGTSGYQVQEVRIVVRKGDGTTCATCRMPKFR